MNGGLSQPKPNFSGRSPRRSPSMLSPVDTLAESRVTDDEREQLRHVLMDGLLEQSLGEDDETNAYGHRIGRLIDALAYRSMLGEA